MKKSEFAARYRGRYVIQKTEQYRLGMESLIKIRLYKCNDQGNLKLKNTWQNAQLINDEIYKMPHYMKDYNREMYDKINAQLKINNFTQFRPTHVKGITDNFFYI